MHCIKTLVYVRELELMRDVFIHFDLSLQVICSKEGYVKPLFGALAMTMNWNLTLNDAWQLSAPFHTPKRSSTPNTASYQLEPTHHQNECSITCVIQQLIGQIRLTAL
jgi:hypothetical protein